MAVDVPAYIYACTTTECSDRFRGFTDEPTFCSICLRDLTEIHNAFGSTLDEVNAMVAAARDRSARSPGRPTTRRQAHEH